jgi:Holliday junction DNA helicase RuvB
LNVDAHGLDEMDNKITIDINSKEGLLVCLLWQPYQSSETIEEVYEPFLIQEGLL